MMRVALPLALLFCSATHAGDIAPWMRIGSPQGGDASCFVFDQAHPGVALAGSTGGFVYRSTDGGTTWTRISAGRPDEEFRVIGQSPATPNTFFAYSTGYTATGFSGRVHVSTDDGVTWQALPNQPKTADGLVGYGRGIAIDSTGQIIVLSDHLAGILRSTDGGQSWTNPLPRASARPYGLANDTAHPGTLYLAGSTPPDQATGTPEYAAIWKSTDFGATWTVSTPPVMNPGATYPSAYAIAVQPVTGKLLATYEGQDASGNTVASGVAKSGNAGRTWAAINTGILPDFFPGNASGGIIFDANRLGYAYLTNNGAGALDGGGLYRTGDLGAQWAPIGRLHPYGGGFVGAERPAMPGYPAALFVGTPDITFSTDEGSHWTKANSGLANTPLLGVADGGAAGLFYAVTETNVVYSTDGGRHWAQAGDWTGSHTTQSLAVDTTRSAPAIFVSTLDNLWRSTKPGGGGWVSVKPSLMSAGQYVTSLTVDAGGRLYATVAPNTLYRSTDDGASWSAVTVGGASDSFGYVSYQTAHTSNAPLALTNAPAGDPMAGRIYASLSSGLWVSNDYGSTWSLNAAQPDPTNLSFQSMAVQHSSPYALFVNTDSETVVSTDGGASFQATPQNVTYGSDFSPSVLVTPPSGTQVFAVSGTSDVVLSTDGFTTASNIAAQLADFDSQYGVAYLSATSGNLFLADPNGFNLAAPYSGLH